MNYTSKSAVEQWGFGPDAGNGSSGTIPPPGGNGFIPAGSGNGSAPASPAGDSFRRQGFFEAITPSACPMNNLQALLHRFEVEAAQQIAEADQYYALRIAHCENEIGRAMRELTVLREKLIVEEAWRETEDAVLLALKEEYTRLEAELVEKQSELTAIRIKLGEAKSGIIQKSLDEAELQVQTALGIQYKIYQATRTLNHQKFADEEDYLKQLAIYFNELYKVYEQRYKAINERLSLLDVDGISPMTTQVLTSIGVVAFAAAGFFFSTFASAAGFGNQDLLYFVVGGLMDTIRQSHNWWVKISVLVGLLFLVTLFSWLTHLVLERMRKRSQDEMFSKVLLKGYARQKLDKMDFELSIKSNNWFAFWLQLLPVILIVGLIMLGTSSIADKNSINFLNSSSEGIIAGTGIAMAVAGLMYLYIIKVVEPRLLKRYREHPDATINWFRANWELALILVLYLIVASVIVMVPYVENADKSDNPVAIVGLDYRTRYAVLLFIAITLVGGISFSYSVRSRGLIQSGRYIERALQRINEWLAYCAAPETPELHHQLTKEHANVIEHVLRQLSFRAALPLGTILNAPVKPVTEPIERNIWGWIRKLIPRKEKKKEEVKEGIAVLTETNALEERYFPHIVDELKAAEFAYNDKKSACLKAADRVYEYKSNRVAMKQKIEAALVKCEALRVERYREKEGVLREKMDQRDKVRQVCQQHKAAFLDGFHLGIWYRENGMGPVPGYYQSCAQPPQPVLLLPAIPKTD